MARYSITLTNDFEVRLSTLAQRKAVTKAEVLRRAIATYAYLSDQVDLEKNRKVSITDKHDSVIKDVVFP